MPLNKRNNASSASGEGGAARAILGFSVPTWINFAVGLLSTPLLTHAFDPDQFGVISLFTVTTEFGMFLLCLGMDSAYLRFYNDPPNQDSKRLFMGKILALCVSIWFCVSLVILLACPRWFSFVVFGSENTALSVLLFINVLSGTILRFFGISYRMELKTARYGVQMVLSNTIRKLGCLLAVFVSPDAVTAIAFQVVILLITVIAYFIGQRNSVLPSREEWRGLRPSAALRGYSGFMRYAVFNAPNYFITYANTMFSLQILRLFCSESAMGIYATASYFVSGLTLIKSGFATFWAPYMYKYYDTRQTQIQRVHGIWMALGTVVFSGMIMLRDLVYTIIGPEYIGGKTVISFILLGSLLQACMETTVYGIYIAKKPHISMIIHAVQFIVCLALCYWLVPLYGILGGALANMLSFVLYFVLSTVMGQKYYKSIERPIKTAVTVAVWILECVLAYKIVDTLLLAGVLAAISALLCAMYHTDVAYMIKIARSAWNKRKERV